MGKSAKLHKRTPKGSAQAQSAKKKAGLKQKAAGPSKGGQGHVLGGADYVDLMMGSRKKAQKEAAKLPRN
ncbi:hypothetical protein C8R46DRAFT_1235524 [Mycena filopes]|nr:hypothetical protein C8R46DRAFT_1235524 [Mycena filopes]